MWFLSRVVLNILPLIVALGLYAFGGAVPVGVGVVHTGFPLWRCRSGLLLVFANVASGFVEGEGVFIEASEEEGVGGTAGGVVARTDRFGCDRNNIFIFKMLQQIHLSLSKMHVIFCLYDESLVHRSLDQRSQTNLNHTLVSLNSCWCLCLWRSQEIHINQHVKHHPSCLAPYFTKKATNETITGLQSAATVCSFLRCNKRHLNITENITLQPTLMLTPNTRTDA